MVKYVSFLRRKAGLTDEEFNKHWKDIHGSIAARVIPGMRKYIQNHIVKTPNTEYEIDGVVEIWFDDAEAFQTYMNWRQTDEAKVLVEDEDKFLDKSKPTRFMVVEHVVKE